MLRALVLRLAAVLLPALVALMLLTGAGSVPLDIRLARTLGFRLILLLFGHVALHP